MDDGVNIKFDREIFEHTLKKINYERNKLQGELKNIEEIKNKLKDTETKLKDLQIKNEALSKENSDYQDKLSKMEEKDNNEPLEIYKFYPSLSYLQENIIEDFESFEKDKNTLFVEKENLDQEKIDDFLKKQKKYGNYIFNFPEEFILKALTKNEDLGSYLLNMANKDARNNKNFAEVIGKKYIHCGLKYFTEAIRSDLETCNTFVNTDFKNLEYTNLSSEDYLSIFFNCIEEDFRIYQYLDPIYKNNNSFYCYGETIGRKIKYKNKLDLKVYPELIILMDANLIKKIENTDILIDENGNLLKYLPKEIKEDEEYILRALKSYPKYIREVSNKKKNNKQFILKAYKANPEIEKYHKINLSDEEKDKEKYFEMKPSFLKNIFKS